MGINKLIHFTAPGKDMWVSVTEEWAEDFARSIQTAVPGAEFKLYCAGDVPFRELPAEVQDEVRKTLANWTECKVIYNYGAFHVILGGSVSATYPADECVAGKYTKKTIAA